MLPFHRFFRGGDRRQSRASAGNTVAFDYRAHGTALAGKRWLRNDAAVASATAQYDAWGNITDISFGAPGSLHSIGYLYDVADRRTQASLPDGTKWLYGYDRLSQVTSGERVDATTNAPVSGGSFRYAYDGIGNRTTSQDGSNADLRNYTANSLNQYTSIFSPGIIPIRGRADADAKVAVTTTIGGVSTTYLPDRSGQDFSLDIPVDNSSGAVTAAVQVDALKHDGTLDLDLHRRLSGDYTVSAATPEQPAYDADGNLLTCDGWTYTWNAQDRLVSATRETTRLEFNYDYLGRRFEKKVYENNVLTKHSLFIYDGFKQIAEYDALAANALANTYLWQPVGLDVPLLRNGGEFYVSDANKNIVALLDTTGQVTDTYVYDPFGNCTHSGSSTNSFQFSSEYYDAETGLVYYNYRYYCLDLGRWIKRDAIGESGGENLYGIKYNSTPNYFDYLGFWLPKDHRLITQIALVYIQHSFDSFNVSQKATDKIYKTIVEANIDTDSGSTKDNQAYHYCTAYSSNVISREESIMLYSNTLQSKFDEWRNNIIKGNCEEALKVLGILSHMLQDYYAHGVEYDKFLHQDYEKTNDIPGKDSIIGRIRGNPDNPVMDPVTYEINGFRGMHGGIFKVLLSSDINKIEPAYRADDLGYRRQMAIEFTTTKFRIMFPVWLAKCKCFYQ
ncbi:MAG: RHS repeat-associated core domain-containing protein [Victivallales bacterium]|nr:RHS repeat-associated core domain-containing protein [Victivallales bacterium]